MPKPRVSFLYTGNSARSQRAEVFLRAYAEEYFDAPANFQGSDSEILEFTRKVRDQMDERVRPWLKEQSIQPALP